jgi:hypothetical protein
MGGASSGGNRFARLETQESLTTHQTDWRGLRRE